MEPCSNSHLQNPNDGESKDFPQFDVVTQDSDHYYVKLKPTVTGTGGSLYKNIMKEWKILQNNLPKSIYVRVYEGRIDLLRAVIVGAAGTPYHDGLFFFDFAFPSDYPNKPPLVYYWSFGLRLNPNLYEHGYVCLSLLNTWSGPKWECNRSTILQVLISLQGLVLNEKPFFNEPMYTGRNRKLFDKMSRDYNNNVFVLSCKTMMFLLRNPPKNFEGFVVEHFRNRGRAILTACKAYTNGFVRVGDYQDSGVFLPERVKVSKKLLMNVQYPLLVQAFSKNDSSLKEFLVQLNQIMKKTEDEYTEKAKAKAAKVEKNNKVMVKFSGILKKFWGLNKCAKSNDGSTGNNSS